MAVQHLNIISAHDLYSKELFKWYIYDTYILPQYKNTKEKQVISEHQRQICSLFIKQKQTQDIENRLLVAKGRQGGGEKDWEFGISRCKLVYIE